MRCSSCEPLLDRYVEGTLTPREMLNVRAHVRHCSACAALVSELRVVDALLATTQPIELAPNFTFAVMAEARSTAIHTRRRFALWQVLGLYLVAAWLALCGAYVAFGGRLPFLDRVRDALAGGGEQVASALTTVSHSFGTTTPLVLASVIGVLILDALLTAGAIVLYRTVRARALHSEAS